MPESTTKLRQPEGCTAMSGSRVWKCRERVARLYDKRIKAGLCPRCGGEHEGKHYYCEACNHAHNEHKRALKRIPFRNCFCGAQAERTSCGEFYCGRHWEAEISRRNQDRKP